MRKWILGLLSVAGGCAVVGCAAKDGVVGEVDGEAGAAAGGHDGGSLKYSLQMLRFASPEDGLCLPSPLPVVGGQVACSVLTTEPRAGACCEAPLRSAVDSSVAEQVHAEMRDGQRCDVSGAPACTDYCVCAISPAEGADLEECLDPYGGGGDGWCYVSPAQGLGSVDAVRDCQGDAPHQLINVAGAGRVREGEQAFLACATATGGPAPKPRELGKVCVSSEEQRTDYSGAELHEVTVDANDTCKSGICLVNHFEGRVSCPYGQGTEDPSCFLPGSEQSVSVPVRPQIEGRPPSLASTCSCRCAGPGEGPFCECGAGLKCVDLIADLGIPGTQDLVGSYCVPVGAERWQEAQTSAYCDESAQNCGDARPY